MSQENRLNNLSKKVIEEIKKEQVKMKPKVHFILKTAFIALSIILITLFALYLISFMIFNLKAMGAWYLPVFGLVGFKALFGSLPWLLIILSLCLIILMEILIKYFSFGFRTPMLYSLIIIITIVLIGGFMISRTTFHSKMIEGIGKGQFGQLAPFYRCFCQDNRDVVNGEIISIQDNRRFVLKTNQEEELIVTITPKTRFNLKDIKSGQAILILGQRDNGHIEAKGIKALKKPLMPLGPLHILRFRERK